LANIDKSMLREKNRLDSQILDCVSFANVALAIFSMFFGGIECSSLCSMLKMHCRTFLPVSPLQGAFLDAIA
jgi:hypothetical protein